MACIAQGTEFHLARQHRTGEGPSTQSPTKDIMCVCVRVPASRQEGEGGPGLHSPLASYFGRPRTELASIRKPKPGFQTEPPFLQPQPRLAFL